jgi:membrane-bound metal-dependent hydrolase YbcI (DUF457 family)
MMGKSHVLFGTAAAAAYIYTVTTGTSALAETLGTTVTHPVVTAGLCILGSLLPDIDNSLSTIGQKMYPLSYAIESKIGHRTYTHDIVFWLLPALLSLWKCPILFGLFVGILSHLFLDAWTISGIPVFYLINKNFRLHLMPVPSWRVSAQTKMAKVETWVFTVILVLLAFPMVRAAAGNIVSSVAVFLRDFSKGA